MSSFTKLSDELRSIAISTADRVEKFGAPKPQLKKRDSKVKPKNKVVTGMRFGDLIVRRKLPPKKASKPNLRERWKCECVCGKVIDVPRYYLLRKPNPKTHCGCRNATIKSTHKREYLIWHMMHQRCENPNHSSYKHYQRIGVKIHPLFHKDREDDLGFENFLNEVGPCPTKYHSLDRVRNAEGYNPKNLRWATSEEQRANQGDRIAGYTSEEIEAMGYTEDEFVEKIIKGEIT